MTVRVIYIWITLHPMWNRKINRCICGQLSWFSCCVLLSSFSYCLVTDKTFFYCVLDTRHFKQCYKRLWFCHLLEAVLRYHCPLPSNTSFLLNICQLIRVPCVICIMHTLGYSFQHFLPTLPSNTSFQHFLPTLCETLHKQSGILLRWVTSLWT